MKQVVQGASLSPERKLLSSGCTTGILSSVKTASFQDTKLLSGKYHVQKAYMLLRLERLHDQPGEGNKT